MAVKLFSYSDMGMISCSNHISFQTTANRVDNRNHFQRSNEISDWGSFKARTYRDARFLSLHRICGLHNWSDSLRLQISRQGKPTFKYWWPTSVLWAYIQKRGSKNRKYYIKTMNSVSIDCSGHAYLNQLPCAHRVIGIAHWHNTLAGGFRFLGF